MTKEEKKEAEELKKRLAKLTGDESDDGDDDEDDPKTKAATDLIAKGVRKAIGQIRKEEKGRGKKPPAKDDKGVVESILDWFGIEEG